MKAMCNKAHFEELKNRVDKLEKNYAVHAAQSCEQIKTLFHAVQRLFWITCIFSGILLLTVVYGAVGERGFNHVTDAAKTIAP
jgi:DNA-binding ferritin-like protein (Dps family)